MLDLVLPLQLYLIMDVNFEWEQFISYIWW